MNTSAGKNHSFTQYLKEIGEIPMLDGAEEKELGRRIQQGDSAAREKMITANLRLVIKTAHSYQNCGLPIEDLISEGNIGLTKAVDRFDPGYGAKFSTYATWWIKQSIREAVGNQRRTIRVPLHTLGQMRKLSKAAFELTSELGREPTDEELGRHTQFKQKQIDLFRRASMTIGTIDGPNTDHEASLPLRETVADPQVVHPADVMDGEATLEEFRSVLKVLSERELGILTARYGLNGDQPRTLTALGQDLGVTRERVRQLQSAAMKKLAAEYRRIKAARANSARNAVRKERRTIQFHCPRSTPRTPMNGSGALHPPVQQFA